MARRRKMGGKTAAPGEFSHSPFKRLKGLSASVAPTPAPAPAKQAPAAAQEEGDERTAFADEMDLLGVAPLPGRAARKQAREAVETPTTAPQASREERDRADFLAALGDMQATFTDEWPEESFGQAAPRRMREVARGRVRPEAELDLHGLNVEEACAKVRFFLENAVFQGCRVVLIITGRGLHSSDGPVLRGAVEKLLAQMSDHLLEWGPAPKRDGGDGALVVFLRRPAGR